MDFTLTEKQQAFRREVRALLRAEPAAALLAELAGYGPREEPHPRELYRLLGSRGWLAAGWPEEYGGGGGTVVESAIVAEELCWAGAPDTAHLVTVDIVGLFLLLAGSAEQKARLLPAMAAGDSYVAVLYSEPDVGSDLAGLRTVAEPDGDAFALYGTKVYSLRTADADLGLCAARIAGSRPGSTEGITLFLVPMRAEGVTVSPLWNLSDERFGRVELTGVRVGPLDVLGAVGEGWRLLTGALAVERTGLEQSAKARHWLDRLTERARSTGRSADPAVAARLSELDAQVEAGRLLAWQVVSRLAHGEIDNALSSMSKLHSSELARQLVDLGQQIDGLDAVLSRWEPDAPGGGFSEWLAREAPGVTISAGTSEIMRYVVAGAGLEAARSWT